MTKAQSRQPRDLRSARQKKSKKSTRPGPARLSFEPGTRSSERMQQAVRVLGRVLARRIDELEQLRAASRRPPRSGPLESPQT